jgi:hypothetical protein
VYYAGIKIFKTLPASIKRLNHAVKVFKSALRDHLSHAYTLEEFA